MTQKCGYKFSKVSMLGDTYQTHTIRNVLFKATTLSEQRDLPEPKCSAEKTQKSKYGSMVFHEHCKVEMQCKKHNKSRKINTTSSNCRQNLDYPSRMQSFVAGGLCKDAGGSCREIFMVTDACTKNLPNLSALVPPVGNRSMV